VLTSFLIASKYDELDENIPLIKDLTRFFCRILPAEAPTPTFTEVVECERELMNFHRWDLMIVTPTVITQLLQANGVLFNNEEIEDARKAQIVEGIDKRIKEYLEVLVRCMTSIKVDHKPS
jgi:hypothetical protein